MKNYTFNYEGNNIEFSFREDGRGSMINATEMAKPFGKRPSKWLELPSTKEFLKVLVNIRKLDIDNLIVSVKGGSNFGPRHGTWMHEDVAIEFARWLNPAFSIWCNDRIKEIMINGYTVIDQTRESFEKAYNDIQQRLAGG